MQDRVCFIEALGEVTWPEHAVFIADRALPDAILHKLPRTHTILVDAGEPLKRLASIETLAEQVLALHSSRPLTLVAVGGGSVGDAVGFLASVLWRGVDLWHVPTTLLAMVDSAHGGKTAVNLGVAKNQLGTFYQAERILIAREILAALPFPQRREGLAELIKGLWLDDAAALPSLDDMAQELASAPFAEVGDALFDALERAIAVKYRIVARDLHETLGIRTFLNFGHTIAHVLELEFGLPHGVAVAWGMYVAASLSVEHGGLELAQADRLRAHVEPILSPMTSLSERLPRERFEALAKRDKKRIDKKLRSVLLHAPGAPYVTDEITSGQWYDALIREYEAWSVAPRSVRWTRRDEAVISIASSKSELNRALLIAHLRPGLIQVDGASDADDVVYLRRALEKMRAEPTREVTVQAGLGGTTFRFLLAAAAVRQAPTIIMASARLLDRPHGAMYQALEQLGARHTPVEGGVQITPCGPIDGVTLTVRADASSQFASALAMLSASGASLLIQLTTSESGAYAADRVASAPYLKMTLDMLEEVGVVARWEQNGRISLDGSHAAMSQATLVAHPDESSAAVWRVARFLGAPVSLAHEESSGRQPDSALEAILRDYARTPADEIFSVSLHESPDLAPVLTAAAVMSEAGLEITGASHLRLKESNRIEELCEAYADVGIEVLPRQDGLLVPVGIQRAREGAAWRTFEDHRLAMTGALLTLRDALHIEEPWVVAKSYPGFWADLRRAGARFLH